METDFAYVETNHYHYIKFTVDDGVNEKTYNSYVDFGLYLEEPVQVSAPAPNTYMLDVPGRNGSLDLTESAIGGVTYKDREMVFRFLCRKRRTEWNSVYHSLLNAIHGKHCKIVCSDDPNYYYEGRVIVNKWENNGDMAFPEVVATVRPYKTKIRETAYSVKLGLREDTLLDIPGTISTSTEQSRWVPILYGNNKTDFSTYTAMRISYQSTAGTEMSIIVTDNNGNKFNGTLPWEKTGNFRLLRADVESRGVVWADISDIRIENVLFPRILSVQGVLSSNARITVGGSGKPVVPTIFSEQNVYMTVAGKTYTVTAGGWSNENVAIYGHDTEFSFCKINELDSSGVVSITYQEGWL